MAAAVETATVVQSPYPEVDALRRGLTGLTGAPGRVLTVHLYFASIAGMSLFITCPVESVDLASAFYTALGWSQNPDYSGDGVACFTLDKETGSWSLTQERMHIPADTKEFAINASNMRHWHEPVRRYVDELLAGSTGPRGRDFNMRWVASMVADVHRILTRGGIFMYPADARDPDKPGKLRLMYEANPMAFIVEQAGGAATDGKQRILDIQPEKLHQRVAVFLGSKNEVDLVTSYHRDA